MAAKKAEKIEEAKNVEEVKVETASIDQPAVAPVQQDPEKTGRLAKKAGKIILGIIITLVGIAGVYFFWPDFLRMLKGVIGVIVILIGLIIIALGWTD